jgi:hypothetical protein
MLKVFEIAVPVDPTNEGYENRFDIDPNKMYPATVAHIVGVLDKQAQPDGALQQEYVKALALPAEAWAVALASKADCAPELVEARAEALTIARRWFTEILQSAVGGPINPHITKNEKYRE